MKKVIVALALALTANVSFAQNSNIQSASNSLRDKEYKDALEYINKALNDPSTANSPKAWLMKANIYMAMQGDAGYAAQNPYKEGVAALQKTIEADPKHKPEIVTPTLRRGAIMYYNDAFSAYNAQKYDEAYEAAKKVVEIRNTEGGKRFAGDKVLDTLAADALYMQAFSLMNANKTEDAIVVLESLRESPIKSSPTIYQVLIDAYGKTNKNDRQLALIEEARKKFPTSKEIANAEINYYVANGQTDVMLKKLEQALAANPDDISYAHEVGQQYNIMAFPSDNNGKQSARPANYNELLGKAEGLLKKAADAQPDNLGYSFDIASLYYNAGAELTNEMNKLGTTPEDDKKYKELEKVRTDYYAKATPYLQKVYTTLEPKVGNMNADDKLLYQSSLVAMREIYARQNQLDKSAELKAKLEASRK